MDLYLEDFTSKQDIINEFNISPETLNGCNILFAWYEYESYTGTAFVLFEKDGNLYEVNGSHCSCYGLEGQWEPEETTKEAIRYRINNGELGKSYYEDKNFDTQLLAVLDKDLN
jgi:hypothetical protein